MRLLTKYPPILMMGGLFLEGAWVQVFERSPNAALQTLAFLLILISTILIAWSFYIFQTHKTPILPDRIAKSIITHGPFALSRNPIYLAMAITLLAAGLWWATWTAIPIAFLFCWIVTKTHILHEEAMLIDQFGDTARTYFAKTPRWIGPI